MSRKNTHSNQCCVRKTDGVLKIPRGCLGTAHFFTWGLIYRLPPRECLTSPLNFEPSRGREPLFPHSVVLYSSLRHGKALDEVSQESEMGGGGL